MIRIISKTFKSCKSTMFHDRFIDKQVSAFISPHFQYSSKKDNKHDNIKEQNSQKQEKIQNQSILDKIGNLTGAKKLAFIGIFAILGGTLSYAVFGQDSCEYVEKKQLAQQRERSKRKSTFGGSWELVDTNNKPFRSEDIGDNYYLIYFGYTKCPDICPTTLQYLTKVAANMNKSQIEPAKLKIVFVSVDPNRDNPQVIRNYLSLFNQTIIGLSGISEDDTRLKEIMKKYKVYSNKIPNPNGFENSYNVDHTSLVFLMNPKHQYVDVVNTNLSEKQAANQLLKKIIQDKGHA